VSGDDAIACSPLTRGNAAKIYCLNRLERLIGERSGRLRLLDLGCGTGQNFRALLERHPDTSYTGIEPSPQAAAEARRLLRHVNATIVNAPAYDFAGGPYDVVLSFSVLEHVYGRRRYLRCARRNLHEGGLFFINYDSGHFVIPTWRDRAKNVIGPLLARVGIERYYQSLVREVDFRAMAADAGFRVAEARSFNTVLKGVAHHIAADQEPEFQRRWLEFEEYLNGLFPNYDDSMASMFRTRNFVLVAV
jgi:SAM-dependent methyltransferase